MNHAELVAVVTDHVEVTRPLSKADVAAVLNALAGVIQVELEESGEVFMAGVGKFSTKTRAARTGRNPQTGETIQIPEKVVVDFSPAKTLRDAAG